MSAKAPNVDKDISGRISIIRYLLICGIVLRHTQPSARITLIDGPFDFLIAFTHTLFQCAVPMLTCISAYLMYKAAYDLRFSSLVKKKTRMILIPLIFWNIPLMIVAYYLQKMGGFDHGFKIQAYPFEIFNWLDGTIGLFAAPINYPLNFLRDLFVLCLLCPLFGILLRRAPWLGLALVSTVFWFDLDDQVILRDSMAINFFVGGMAALLGWNLRRLDRHWRILLGILVSLTVACVVFQVEDQRWFRIVSPFLVWPVTSFLVSHWTSGTIIRWSSASFVIFLSHGPLLLAFWLAYKRFGSFIPVELFWTATPILVIALGHMLHRSANVALPGVARVAFGSR